MALQELFLVSICVLLCTGTQGSSNFTFPETSLEEIGELRDVLANLTAAQNDVWMQQSIYEEKIRSRNKEEDERHQARTLALEQEHHLLKEIWATVNRKLKLLTKKNHKDDLHIGRIQPKDCADLYLEGEITSGLYKIWPTWFKNNTGFVVYCDMETAGGGWTVIHRWGNYTSFPRDYFKRSWGEYKNGFGDLESAFWLGNNMISALTSQGAYNLRFDFNGEKSNAILGYRSFWIENESQYYKLHVEGFTKGERSPTVVIGDIFGAHNNMRFSTFDNSKIQNSGECTRNFEAIRPGWWFSESCPLNEVFRLQFANSLNQGSQFFKSEMKIRPADFQRMKETP